VEHSHPPHTRTSGLALAWRRWRGRAFDRPALDALPCLAVAASCVSTLDGPAAFRETLLAQVKAATQRILIPALYLQDDEAGRAVLAALYAARQARPQLQIAVFVDWHRAQRGLIGKAHSPGNVALYRDLAQRLGPGVPVYGVAVQRREFMGVMHLKGLIIDDCVLYSGASINDVYLQWHTRYRLDRYHLIRDRALADSLAGFVTGVLANGQAVLPIDNDRIPRTLAIRDAIVRFRRVLARARYHYTPSPIGDGQVGVTPLLGLGARDNELNATLVQLIRRAQKTLVVFTPYFNLPGPLRVALDARIKAGCHVTIVLGDKTANDFYIPPSEPFKTIGALPYLYEANLRRFCKMHQRAISSGQLDVHLWRHGDNSFHLKGLLVDDDYALLTGNNLNPRAWRLDLENALLIHDPQRLLIAQHRAELEKILAHTQRLADHAQIDSVDTYPPPAQRLLRRLARVRADRLVNQVL
jgi:CDP-diacylglycerol---serine O-phosphatidyltransferase